jgi:hypothetical protein
VRSRQGLGRHSSCPYTQSHTHSLILLKDGYRFLLNSTHTHTHAHTGDHKEKKGAFTGYYVVLTDDLLPYYRAATPMSPARAQWRDGKRGARERTGVGSDAKLEKLKERGEKHSHVTQKGYVPGLLECVRGMCVNPYWSVSEICVCLHIPRYVVSQVCVCLRL